MNEMERLQGIEDKVMLKRLKELVKVGKSGSCPCGQYHCEMDNLRGVLDWALQKLG
jgi:hypothetical protein